MKKRSRKTKSKRGASKRGRARAVITLLLLVVIGFFGFSIYLGYTSSPGPAGKSNHPARNASLDLPERAVPTLGSPTLVIENGCGRPGLGAKAERWLRRQGFDVFETRNADRMDYAETVIVARSGRTEAAQAVLDRLQHTLGIGVMIQQRAKVPEADVLLILGKDFPDSLPVF
jgi:hypothetical protein